MTAQRAAGVPSGSGAFGTALFGAATVAAALAVGAAAASQSPKVMLGAIPAAAVAAAILMRPAVGALAVFALFAIVPQDTVLGWSVPFVAEGGVKVTDALIALTLGAWLIRVVVDPASRRFPGGGVTLLVIGIGGLIVLGLATARGAGADTLALVEMRPLLGYLLVLPVISGIHSRRDLERGVAVILAVFAGVCLVTLYRYAQGQGELASFADGALRVRTVNFVFPLLAVIWAVALLPFAQRGGQRLVLIGFGVLGAAALFATFNRAAWLVALAAIPVVVLMLPSRRRGRSLAALLTVGLIGACAVVGFNSMSAAGSSDPVAAATERLGSVGQGGGDASTQYRINEWNKAVETAREQPLTGIGFGGTVVFENPLLARSPTGSVFTQYYIHNSYLWFLLKLGIVGFAWALALVLIGVGGGLRGYARARDPRIQAVLLGTTISIGAVALLSLTDNHLARLDVTPLMALLVGITVAAPRLARRSS